MVVYCISVLFASDWWNVQCIYASMHAICWHNDVRDREKIEWIRMLCRCIIQCWLCYAVWVCDMKWVHTQAVLISTMAICGNWCHNGSLNIGWLNCRNNRRKGNAMNGANSHSVARRWIFSISYFRFVIFHYLVQNQITENVYNFSVEINGLLMLSNKLGIHEASTLSWHIVNGHEQKSQPSLITKLHDFARTHNC